MAARPVTDDHVSVSEGRIHFMKAGSGPPVALLHPLGTSTWAWHKVLEPLGQHFTCYAFDMLGHGLSEKPKRDFSMPDFGRTLNQAMEKLNIPGAHIVGNSVGALLAIELAASYPSKVNKLVLVGAPVTDPRIAPQVLTQSASGYDKQGLPLPLTLESAKAGNSFFNPKPEWIAENNKTRAKAGIWMLKTMEALAWYDTLSRLPRINSSATLVLYGEHDVLIVAADTLTYNVPNASKITLPGVGHIPQIEGPESFVSAVVDFLK